MEVNRKQISSILGTLRSSPGGLNVSEVSRRTGLNRSTVAKYLEILHVSGHVDMRMFGTSKLYYISQRMPISAFLNFSSDLIIVLDRDFRVMNANDSFFKFTGTGREDVMHKYFDHFAFPLQFNPSIIPYIAQAIDGHENSIESYYPKKHSGHYFNVKLIPLMFDDGEKGVTIIFEDVTEKKLAEKALLNANFELEKKVRERTQELENANAALRESEGRYRVITENSYDVVYSVRLDGTITYVSGQIARYGYDPEKLINHNFFEFIPPAYKTLLVEKLREAVTIGIISPVEFKFLGSDGEEYWAEGAGKTINDDSGKPIFQVGTMRDVTERKHAEEALRDSELRFKMLFESASTAIVIIDLKTRAIVDCNAYAARLVGRTKEELIGTHHATLHSLESADHSRRDARLHSGNGCVMNHEAELIHKDGHGIPILINGSIMEIQGKKYMIGSYLDITDRKRVEKRLAESETFLRNIFESIQDGISVLDKNLNILQVNSVSEKRYGEIRPGQKCHSYFRGRPEPCESCPSLRAMRDGTTQKEVVYDRVGWSEIYAFPLVNDHGDVIGVIEHVRDINERKLSEEALRKREEKFRSLIEDIEVLVWAMDENFTCTYISPKSRDLLGYEPAELLGKALFDLVATEDNGGVMELVRPRVDAHEPFEIMECGLLRKDGSKIFLKTNAMPLFDCDGQFKGYRGVNRDVTNGRK